jgi:hypothetical protein
MRRFVAAMVATACLAGSVRAEANKDAGAILDKAIKALGGEEKLASVKAMTWKAKGKINVNGMEGDYVGQYTAQGLDYGRIEVEADIGGMKIMAVTVVAGDKGWRKFNDMNMELDKEALAGQKQTAYLHIIPMTLVALKGKDFKVESAGEEKVGDKPALVLKVVGPDGKDFKLYFDKESFLLVKQVAKVPGFMGDEVLQEVLYSNYKDMNGIKKATKLESKRDGQKFIEQEVTEFKLVDKVDPKTFMEP